jgi:S1-C subfamily serine protease
MTPHIRPVSHVEPRSDRSLGVEVAGYRCHARHCLGHLRITSVATNSPATRLRCQHCGRTHLLTPGDVIMRVGSTPVASDEALRRALDQPGPVSLHVMQRQGTTHKDLVMDH